MHIRLRPLVLRGSQGVAQRPRRGCAALGCVALLLPILAILAILAVLSASVAARPAQAAGLPYYWQAGLGQLEIINKRRFISEVLQDPQTPPETARRLRLILDVQDFATRELSLPRDGHYRYYADLGRPYVSWLVVAALPLRLEAHQSCYLIVGCLGYRGYFARADADEYAAELRAEGLDVLVRPVQAYSTLGWFDDPVLNTFLGQDESLLIGTVIHEQTHQRYFLKGETAFNESLASMVEGEGLRRYLGQSEQPRGEAGEALLRRYRAIHADRQRFMALVLRGRDRLVALYGGDLPDDAKRQRKEALFEQLRNDYRAARESFTLLNYEGWFERPLNNAHLVGLSQYAQHVPAFQRLFEEAGRDFDRFFAAVAALGDLPAAERNAELTRLAAAAAGAEDAPPRGLAADTHAADTQAADTADAGAPAHGTPPQPKP